MRPKPSAQLRQTVQGQTCHWISRQLLEGRLTLDLQSLGEPQLPLGSGLGTSPREEEERKWRTWLGAGPDLLLGGLPTLSQDPRAAKMWPGSACPSHCWLPLQRELPPTVCATQRPQDLGRRPKGGPGKGGSAAGSLSTERNSSAFQRRLA